MDMRLEMKDRGMSVYVHGSRSYLDIRHNKILEKLQALLDDLAYFDSVTVTVNKKAVNYSGAISGTGGIGAVGPVGSVEHFSYIPGANGPSEYTVGSGHFSTPWTTLSGVDSKLDYDSFLKKADMTKDSGSYQGRLF